jgi:hypothetical protein
MRKLLFLLFGLAVGVVSVLGADPGTLTGSDDGNKVIQTPVPFLNIAPDSRSGAMGDAGVATEPDINSQHWNPAKYPFIEQDMGFSISYSPWLRKLASDINLAYLGFFKKIDDKQVVSASLRYFSLGQIMFTDQGGNFQKNYTPNEFAIDAAYSRLLTDYFSSAIAFRFIRSDLSGGSYMANVSQASAGIAFAADIASYYRRPIVVNGRNSVLSFGLNISNLGTKISYSKDGYKDFIPTNLKLGGALKTELDQYNSFAVALDLNKLLVPSSMHNALDTIPDVSVMQGVFKSFSDAPGGSKEEFDEIMYSLGAEYWYRNQFAVRGGYYYEDVTKGNRKYFTLGFGLKMNVFNMDFSYLIPSAGQNNPLANTMRFTLAFNFEKAKKKQTKR